ncbi:MAG TPA: NAD(P)-dependent oxidoreductase [Solirubrobacterales bacterium]|jgi:3-hydroxyisobutyrate dehydrogenase-like beta-hydroxyacid dehydrogenase
MRETDARALGPVAVVGLGSIGGALTAHLAAGGVEVLAWDVVPAALDRAEQAGARPASSGAEAAAGGSTVIVCVPDAAALRTAVAGDRGVLEGAAAGALLIDMGTNLPSEARRMAALCAERGVEFVDAPVSGGPRRARSGELSTMAGGSGDAVARAEPLLGAIAAHVFHVGPVGSGQAMKLVNNLLTAVNLAAIGEAVALGVGEGLDLATIHEVVIVSSGDSKRFRDSVPRILRDEVGTEYGRVDILAKDLEMALSVGTERKLPMPAATLVGQIFRVVQAEGQGGRDIEALIEWYARQGGVDPGSLTDPDF